MKPMTMDQMVQEKIAVKEQLLHHIYGFLANLQQEYLDLRQEDNYAVDMTSEQLMFSHCVVEHMGVNFGRKCDHEITVEVAGHKFSVMVFHEV